VNGATTKWHENGAYRFATTKFCQCVLLAYRTGLLQPNAVCYWHTVHCYATVFSYLNLPGCFM
jgi:hypothetical protein